MTVNTRTLYAVALAINGQTIVSAPCACTDKAAFMAGAKEQQENTIHAIADALLAAQVAPSIVGDFVEVAKNGKLWEETDNG